MQVMLYAALRLLVVHSAGGHIMPVLLAPCKAAHIALQRSEEEALMCTPEVLPMMNKG